MSLFNKYTVILFFLVVSLIGNVILWQMLNQSSGQNLSQLRQKYPFLSARALNPNYTNTLVVNFLPLREQIHQQVDPYSNDFAFDFEYLPTGTTIGVNEDKNFTAESLLKVPVVMAYYHKKEVNNIITDPTVQIQQNELNAKFGDLYKKGAGYSINLDDVVKDALQKSDNTASLVLADQISQSDFDFVYAGLDIPETVDKNSPIITAQEYASILKALYFGSVLDNDDSEHILDLLTKTDFNNLIPSGIPKNVPVAHKIGLVNKEIYEDCGIVYLPQKPYILCMVSKSNQTVAQQRMHKLSQLVYQYVAGLTD